ncbi:MAG: ATP-binding protein, partial [Anaerolineaceae bacterium]
MDGQTVLVGTSGGPDSLCLLDGLHRLGFQVIVACFNHGLRPEAVDEMRQVENLAKLMRIPFVTGEGDVAAEAQRRGDSIEATAR